MSMGIYKITNLINGKSYIGQSIDIKRRWQAHFSSVSNNKNPLYCDIREYGITNFNFEIIDECVFDSLDEREVYWIVTYNTFFPTGYNLTRGGSGNGHIVKISNEDLEIIYDLLLNSTIYQKEIANLFDIGEDTISEINQGKIRRNSKYTYPLRINQSKTFCIDCGVEIWKHCIRCSACYNIAQRIVTRPNREELKTLIRHNSFVSIGKQFNVTDNAIRKWCKLENLPFKSSEIKKISDLDWELI